MRIPEKVKKFLFDNSFRDTSTYVSMFDLYGDDVEKGSYFEAILKHRKECNDLLDYQAVKATVLPINGQEDAYDEMLEYAKRRFKEEPYLFYSFAAQFGGAIRTDTAAALVASAITGYTPVWLQMARGSHGSDSGIEEQN